ncbi:YbjN domain-containing protein [Corynebacterium alimapuense]|uniref:YbjN domain-containing protein n=1 Tax=Corynebacterium alimapuense TaxID=1576874 RepID=UPI001FE48AAD|nr:YbjN domain-containing protein [Corynebacterium alimapuense]
MTTPPKSPIPDTPVAPVTHERVAELLESEGLQYRLESAPVTDGDQPVTVVRTGFINAAIAFTVDGPSLVCESMWRGEVPKSEAPKLLGLVNEWNQTQYMPTLRFFESAAGQGHLTVSAHRQTYVVEGLSRNQIGAFIMSSLDGVLRAYEWVEKQLPEQVTWEEPTNEQ